MKFVVWVSVIGTGVVLGACGGFSSLGEVAGNGGEGNDANATGGTQATGATGGTQATGATGGGMNATGGTGMGATGGSMNATGGTGMGATGGSGGPENCMVGSDCPEPPPFCTMCPDGSSPCIAATCEMGVCGFSMPACDAPLPVSCMTSVECGSVSDTISCAPYAPAAYGACVGGACIAVCPLYRGCETNADCDTMLGGDCVVGPPECVDGECVAAAGSCRAM